jgi:hypothetical protein
VRSRRPCARRAGWPRPTRILGTAAYREDCDALLRRFLDHYPYFGMRGDDDAQALHDAYADTIERYRDAFGKPPTGTWISADAASGAHLLQAAEVPVADRRDRGQLAAGRGPRATSRSPADTRHSSGPRSRTSPPCSTGSSTPRARPRPAVGSAGGRCSTDRPRASRRRPSLHRVTCDPVPRSVSQWSASPREPGHRM